MDVLSFALTISEVSRVHVTALIGWKVTRGLVRVNKNSPHNEYWTSLTKFKRHFTINIRKKDGGFTFYHNTLQI